MDKFLEIGLSKFFEELSSLTFAHLTYLSLLKIFALISFFKFNNYLELMFEYKVDIV